MKTVPLTPEMQTDWEAACQTNEQAWFWHTATWLSYQLGYKPESRPVDRSFAVTEGNNILAVCPLIEETSDTEEAAVREFTSGGAPGLAPAVETRGTPAQYRAIEKLAMQHIDELAAEYGIARCALRMSPLAGAPLNSSTPSWNRLMAYGYADRSLNTQVIAVGQPLESLRRDMSKGHRADVRRGLDRFSYQVYDSSNVTPAIFESYQRVHLAAAGRITRPQETFDLMFEWVRDGLGILVAAAEGERHTSFVYVNIYKHGAYYSSSATLPIFDRGPVGHVLQWTAIKWLHEHGYLLYEIGWQQFGPQPHDSPSQKQINISRFKRNFGGVTVPLFMGEKFYSTDYYTLVSQRRIAEYITALEDGRRTSPVEHPAPRQSVLG